MKHLPAFLIGFVFGAAVMCGLVTAFTWRIPPTPVVPPPTAIKVTLYPWEGVGGIDGKSVTVPPEKRDLAFRLLTPETTAGAVNSVIASCSPIKRADR